MRETGVIGVYAATGRLGQVVAREIAGRGAPLVLAGRDQGRLRALAAQLPRALARPAPADEPAALRAAAEGCDVLVNCAPPLRSLSEAVARAAVDAGADYLDAAGEQGAIRALFERLDGPARERGVAVVPACGFDYALGDCLARVAAGGLEPVDRITVAYALDSTDTRRGSLRGAVESDHAGELVYRARRWRPAPAAGVSRATFDFPGTGRRTVTRYGSGEILTVPRHTDVDTVESFITVEALAPHPLLAPALPYLRPLAAMALRTPLRRPLRAAVRSLQRRHGGPAGAAADPGSAFTVAAVARSGGARGCAYARGVHTQRLTAVILAEAAGRLAGGGPRRAGVLSAAAAFDPGGFLDALAAEGVEWHAVREVVRG